MRPRQRGGCRGHRECRSPHGEVSLLLLLELQFSSRAHKTMQARTNHLKACWLTPICRSRS